MSLEHPTDPTGSATNIEGVPYVEILSDHERQVGDFEQWYWQQHPEPTEPQVPIPAPPAKAGTQEALPPINFGEFFNLRREKPDGWNSSGI